jgi:hypothetical protein
MAGRHDSCDVLAVLAAAMLGPRGEDRGATASAFALFLGTSVHVASTGWFFVLPEVRTHARRNPGAFLLTPAALVVLAAILAALASPGQLRWVAADLRLPWGERVAFGVFTLGVGSGLLALTRRKTGSRGFVAMYLVALLFFVPVFCFDSPFPAVAGLTVAHGYQYLLLMGLVSVAPRTDRLRDSGPALLSAIALGGGLVLAVVSHLHDSPVATERALYGAFLGVVMSHFVLDAVLWRLRNEFPRRLLGDALPYLVHPSAGSQPRRA